ncbi:MAG: MFS transporter [Anaerolineales bacterium]|nr:MFS transporter [Anaerolineales bacterium]
MLDALTFLVSIAALWPIRLRSRSTPAPHEQAESVWASIKSGFTFVWRFVAADDLDRHCGVNFFFVGPILVGIPVLADSRLSDGAVAFGVIMAAYAGGNLGGIILAGGIWQVRRLSLFTVAVIAGFGVGLIVFGISPSTWLDVIAMLVLGVANGYISIRFITYVQRKTPSQLIGRVMSLILFANVALVPVSQALSGVLSRNNVTTLFVAAGVATLLLATWMVFQPELKLIDSEMAAPASDSGSPG